MDYYNNQNYYNVLGIEENATIKVIQNAKDRLKFGSPDDRVPFSMWDKIDEAYMVLSDPEKRREYDKQLLEEEKKVYSNTNKQSSSPILTEPIILKETFETSPTSEMEDIYSNTNKQSSSIFATKPIDLQIESEKIDYKKIAKYVGLSLPTAILSSIKIIKTIGRKYILNVETIEKEITEVKTIESQLIEEYEKKLEDGINKLLEEPHNNYKLEIDRLRYENYIELLKKIIEQKENSVSKKGNLTISKLQVIALKKQLQTFKNNLIKVNEKIKVYEGTHNLKKVHEELIKVNKQIKVQEKSSDKKILAVRRLNLRKKALLKLKKFQIQRLKFNREIHAIVKDSVTYSYNTAENFVENLFGSNDKIENPAKSKIH